MLVSLLFTVAFTSPASSSPAGAWASTSKYRAAVVSGVF
jgi:hypothetical protein